MECGEGVWDVTEQEERQTVTQAEPPCVSEVLDVWSRGRYRPPSEPCKSCSGLIL